MKRHFLQNRGIRAVLGMLLIAGVFAASTDNLGAYDKPEIPYLSLTGEYDGYNTDWYPDGRIWLPASDDGPREFLLPIFMENRWYSYRTKTSNDEDTIRYYADPIYSFQFKILYDSAALRAVGVQKFHPALDPDDDRFTALGMPYDPLAKNFSIAWDDYKDYDFKKYLYNAQGVQVDPPDQTISEELKKGRAIRIVGTSTTPLPNTNLQSPEFKVLLYVKFQVIPEARSITGVGDAGKTPIIIANDTIKYNDLNICKEAPFTKLRPYDEKVQDYYPNPDYKNTFTGLAGIDNKNDQIFNTEPTLPGVIYLLLTDALPVFDFEIDRGIGQVPALEEIVPGELYEIKDPITIDTDYGSVTPSYGKRIMKVTNGTEFTRLLDVEVETDSPWLLVRTKRPRDPSDKRIPSLNSETRKGYINWIDNNILGNVTFLDPYEEETDPDGDIQLEIICDPSQLDFEETDEQYGIYVGYITFKSKYADKSPVRIKVTFIYFAVPDEPEIGRKIPGRDKGIEIVVRNSRGQVGDSTTLIFGTGSRASNGVDSLYGEYAYSEPMDPTQFGARWYPLEPEIRANVPFGFGDFAANDEEPRSGKEYFNSRLGSRDIKSSNDTLQSLYYYCRFNAGGAENYPIVIEWDTLDFPVGSQLYIRDTVNGGYFNINMRTGTPIGGSKFTYVINDPRWNSFIIEYTLPRVIEYVDEYGNPIINPGWNFLSLPVRPTNSFWEVVYPNAMINPLKFVQSLYLPEIDLRVGSGYFIKFPRSIDRKFAGSNISEISLNTGDDVRLYEGWNTIGALSSQLNIKDMEFDFFNNEKPDKDKMLAKGVYKYETAKGYKEVTHLERGRGYWIWVDRDGFLKLKANVGKSTGDNEFFLGKQDIINGSDAVSVTDALANSSVVYLSSEENVDVNNFELPPAPFEDMFDVRFANNAYLDNSDMSIVKFKGVQYPVTMNVTDAQADYKFVDPVSNEVLGMVKKGQSGSVKIDMTYGNSVKIEKANANTPNLYIASYPNPVVNNSTIKYSIPTDALVTIELFDANGAKVSTLVNENVSAGEHTIQLNALNLASGSYVCKLSTGNENAILTINVVK